MKITLLAISALLLVPAAAWAGCERADDHPNTPADPVSVCFDGKCDVTTQTFFCSNADRAQIGFANGWVISEGFSEERAAFLNDTPRDPAKLTCKVDGKTIDCLTGR